MARKSDINRKSDFLLLRNLSPCQREYLEDVAASETIHTKRTLSLSMLVSRIIREKMISQGWNCD